MVSSLPMVGASLITCARPWADSSAGMMPSSLVQQLERLERFVVGDRHVGDALAVVQERMLGADAGIVEAGRDGMAFQDLPVGVLQQVGAVAVQHAGAAAGHRGGVAVLDVDAVAAGFGAVDA